MDFLNEFIRGITSQSHIENGAPKTELFSDFKDNPKRPELVYKELSITWYDCEQAIETLMSELNSSDGTYHYKVGSVILDTDELKRIVKMQQTKGALKYERYEMIATSIMAIYY